jgi:hypothetical protein
MPKLISKTDYLIWREYPHNAWMKKRAEGIGDNQNLTRSAKFSVSSNY